MLVVLVLKPGYAAGSTFLFLDNRYVVSSMTWHCLSPQFPGYGVETDQFDHNKTVAAITGLSPRVFMCTTAMSSVCWSEQRLQTYLRT